MVELFLLKDCNKIIITTYHSSEILLNVCNKINYKFDFGVFDEAHRTVGT